PRLSMAVFEPDRSVEGPGPETGRNRPVRRVAAPSSRVHRPVWSSPVGSIRDPIKCCCVAMKFEAFDDSGNRVATASTGCGCCQCGLCCSCPCGPCSRIHLTVSGPSGKKVGRMYRQIPGCCKWMLVPDADNYFVEFDQEMDPATKVLLMSLGHGRRMDYRYFNNNVLDSGRTADGFVDDAGP
ncbi:unnamed protein product, partial [Prorocentrum cordatum]